MLSTPGQTRRPPAGQSRLLRSAPPPRRIGLALGGGSARGWAHIGVLIELAAHGIAPAVVTGTSIGAVVGACHAAGKLASLEAFALSLNRRRMLQLMDLSLGGGLIGGSRLRRRLDHELEGLRIETLETIFAAVATEYGSGREVCLAQGDVVEAIRASYALPGIFPPVRVAGRWLFDGAMSNPVPVSVTRALGADFVIAVNLTSGRADVGTAGGAGEVLDALDTSLTEESAAGAASGRRVDRRRRLFSRRGDGAPGIASVMVNAFSIAQERISWARLAIDPPDVMINARLDTVGLFDFHRAAPLIAHGRLATRRAMAEIEAKLTDVGQPWIEA